METMEANPNLAQASQDMTIVDLMPEGWAIEKDPTPIASMAIAMSAPSPETVLDQAAGNDDSQRERFVPYSPEHMELDEAGVVKPVSAEPGPEPGTGWVKERVQSARRSRAGRAAATLAVAAGGILSLASTAAKAENSNVETCTKRELVRPDSIHAWLTAPGKNRQSANVGVSYPPTPEDCRGVVKRDYQYDVVMMKFVRDHGKLRRETAKLAYMWGAHFTQEEAGTTKVSIGLAGPPQRYECSDGKARTKLILRNRGTIRNPKTNAVIGQKMWRTPFKVVGRVGKHRHVGKRGC